MKELYAPDRMPYDVIEHWLCEPYCLFSIEQEGLYHRLMRYAWKHQVLPADLVGLAEIARGTTAQLERLWKPPLTDLFKVTASGHLIMPSIEKTRREAEKASLERRATNQLRRARLRSVPGELIYSHVVMERDEFTCQICGELLKMEAKFPHPLSPSLDHKIPISRGGAHLYSNVQAAHLNCNMRKSAKVDQ